MVPMVSVAREDVTALGGDPGPGDASPSTLLGTQIPRETGGECGVDGLVPGQCLWPWAVQMSSLQLS